MQTSFGLIPNFMIAASPSGLRRLMRKKQNSTKKKYFFKEMKQFVDDDGSYKWIVWFEEFDDIESEINNLGKDSE